MLINKEIAVSARAIQSAYVVEVDRNPLLDKSAYAPGRYVVEIQTTTGKLRTSKVSKHSAEHILSKINSEL